MWYVFKEGEGAESVIGNGKSGKSMKEQLAEIDAQLVTAGEEAKEMVQEEMHSLRGQSLGARRPEAAAVRRVRVLRWRRRPVRAAALARRLPRAARPARTRGARRPRRGSPGP